MADKRLAQMVAKLAAVHAKTQNARKAQHLDAIQKLARTSLTSVTIVSNEHGYNAGGTHDKCTRCHLPSLERIILSCRSCRAKLPCTSPYCDDARKVASVKCADCQQSGYCPKCINEQGCYFCGKVLCKPCSTQRKGSNTGIVICSEECARETRKRARVAKEGE